MFSGFFRNHHKTFSHLAVTGKRKQPKKLVSILNSKSWMGMNSCISVLHMQGTPNKTADSFVSRNIECLKQSRRICSTKSRTMHSWSIGKENTHQFPFGCEFSESCKQKCLVSGNLFNTTAGTEQGSEVGQIEHAGKARVEFNFCKALLSNPQVQESNAKMQSLWLRKLFFNVLFFLHACSVAHMWFVWFQSKYIFASWTDSDFAVVLITSFSQVLWRLIPGCW